MELQQGRHFHFVAVENLRETHGFLRCFFLASRRTFCPSTQRFAAAYHRLEFLRAEYSVFTIVRPKLQEQNHDFDHETNKNVF